MAKVLWNPELAKAAAAKSVATRQRKAAERALLRGEQASLPVATRPNGKHPAQPNPTKQAVDPRSERTRNLLAAELENQARMLIAAPCVTVGELFTSDGTQGRAAVVKSIVDAASALHGWGKGGDASISGSQLRNFDTEVIDIDEVKPPGPDTEQPKQVLDVSSITQGDIPK